MRSGKVIENQSKRNWLRRVKRGRGNDGHMRPGWVVENEWETAYEYRKIDDENPPTNLQRYRVWINEKRLSAFFEVEGMPNSYVGEMQGRKKCIRWI